jgi:formyltetrahydrofolate deformylase
LIISNHPDLKPVADAFNIEFKVFKITKDTKRAVEDGQIAMLEEYRIDFVVLARYMQIISDEFCKKYPASMINIHHSFLPAFIGAKPYHRAHERGVKLIGATAHYVTANLDEGQ